MLSEMRDENTTDEQFKRLMDRVAPYLLYEALSDMPLVEKEITTPVEKTHAEFLESKKIALVPVLGAGQAFLSGMWSGLVPWATAGMIAARRDHDSLKATLSYSRLPKSLAGWKTILVDPMLATGGSSSDAINLIKQETHADDIILINLVAAPEGVSHMQEKHPDIPVFTLALDRGLNKKGYIMPGLGDAGNRYFGINPD